MLIRALIVLLLALNLGAAAWWMTRSAPAPTLPPAFPADVPRLQLVTEAATVALASPPAAVQAAESVDAEPLAAIAAAPEPVAATAVTPVQCYSLGPFVDADAAKTAASRLGSGATRTVVREIPGRAASGYQVALPAQVDRDAAQALAQRIKAAGFDDFLVINTGDATNGIALGRYATREAAQRRQTALQAAGFPAQLQPIGSEPPGQWWLELAAAPGGTEAQLRQTTAAGQSRPLDCATLR